MDEITTLLRQTNPEDTDSMAQYESPNGDVVCASYVDRTVSDQIGEYAELTVSEEGDNATGHLSNETKNYAVFETPGGAITGLYVALSEFDGEVPTSVDLSLASADEEAWEEEAGVDEEEADALLA